MKDFKAETKIFSEKRQQSGPSKLLIFVGLHISQMVCFRIIETRQTPSDMFFFLLLIIYYYFIYYPFI